MTKWYSCSKLCSTKFTSGVVGPSLPVVSVWQVCLWVWCHHQFSTIMVRKTPGICKNTKNVLRRLAGSGCEHLLVVIHLAERKRLHEATSERECIVFQKQEWDVSSLSPAEVLQMESWGPCEELLKSDWAKIRASERRCPVPPSTLTRLNWFAASTAIICIENRRL